MRLMVALLVVIALAGAWWFFQPVVHEHSRRTKSADNLKNLATLIVERGSRPIGTQPKLEGKAFVLSLVASNGINRRNTRGLRSLFSPDQVPADFETFAKRYEAVTWEALRAGMDVRDLTSYAGRRRFDALPQLGRTHGRPLLADVTSDPDHAIVAFADGTCEILDREALQMGPDDPIVVGPESTSPLLRTLSDQ